MIRKYQGWLLVLALLMLSAVAPKAFGGSAAAPVYLGIDAEFGYQNSTSAEAISRGGRIAIEKINGQGGVLGGRPLALVERGNNSIPARSLANLGEFAATPDLVAVLGGRFSPPIIADLPLIHERHLILLGPWAAADDVVENGYVPNYVFRLSLKESDALAAMLDHARRLGVRRVGLLLNTSWGRNSLNAAERIPARAQGGPTHRCQGLVQLAGSVADRPLPSLAKPSS